MAGIGGASSDSQNKKPPSALAHGAQFGDTAFTISGIDPGDNLSRLPEVLHGITHGGGRLGESV